VLVIRCDDRDGREGRHEQAPCDAS